MAGTDNTAWRAQMHGKIAALELLITTCLIDQAQRAPFGDPLGSIREMRAGMLASLQHLDRDVGPYEDAVWAQCVDTLNEMFGRAEMRIRNALRD